MTLTRPTFRGTRWPALGLAVALSALAGCTDIDTPSSNPGSAPNAPVDLGAGSLDQAVAKVTARLTAGGYRVLSTDAGAGIVTAATGAAAAIDCGTIRQTYNGTQGAFAGTAGRAVVFAANMPGGLVLREVETSSRVTVRVQAGKTNTALIGERHKVQISQHTANGSRLVWTETQEFDGQSRVRFADGTTCGSSGAIRKILR